MTIFTVYTKDGCPQCEQAKELLGSLGLPFRAVRLGEGITREELLAKFPGARSMPQVLREDGTSALRIGGLAELRRHLYA
jgi:glutaredoxin 3